MTNDFITAVRRYELEIAQAMEDCERRVSQANQRLAEAMRTFERNRGLGADTSHSSCSQSANSTRGRR